MIRRPWTAAARAAAVVLLAACGATPAPSVDLASSPSIAHPTGDGTAAISSPPAASAAPVEPTAVPAPSFGAALRVGELDASTTESILAFASDGASVLFSSGMAADAARDAAPDLYRLDPVTGTPERVWRNPRRDWTIVKLGGDLGLSAWVEIPTDGARAWTLWLLPRHEDEPIALARHPGDAEVSSLVPSFDVDETTVAWTAFGRGPTGPVSRLWIAREPDWEPTLVAERDAAHAELWLPSLWGLQLAYCEVVYRDDRTRDERHVLLADLGDPTAAPRRLDESGLATMPLSVDGAVYWKEADPGFNMFNWGRMFRHDLATGATEVIDLGPQDYVNYPSAGARYLAWWGADAFRFAVHDTRTGESRAIAAYATATEENVLRPHVAWDLLTWLHVDFTASEPIKRLRWAFLPSPRDP